MPLLPPSLPVPLHIPPRSLVDNWVCLKTTGYLRLLQTKLKIPQTSPHFAKLTTEKTSKAFFSKGCSRWLVPN